MNEVIVNKNNIYKIIKNKKYKESTIGIKIDDQIYYDDSETNYKYNDENFWYPLIVTAFNIKDIKQRYKYIYDKMCFILDNYICIHCDFKCDRCIANRLRLTKYKIDGCCYFSSDGQCKYLKDKICQKKSISCKLYMCMYIENKLKFKSLPKSYPLIKYFFNKKQYEILQHSYKQEFDEIIDKLIENI